MPQVQYVVDFHEGAWTVTLRDRRFGPYSTLDYAMLAAMGAARKAEALGYDASVSVAEGAQEDVSETVGDPAPAQ